MSRLPNLYRGDCLKVLPTLPACSVDAVVTDPPAGIAFMGKDWDTFPTRKRPEGFKFSDGHSRPGLSAGQEFRKGNREPFIAFLSSVMSECFRVAKPGAYALVWAIPRTSHWTGMAIEDAGWVIQDRISHLFGQGFPKHKSKLKPACEDWWLAWKPDRCATPLPGLDACRIGTDERTYDLKGGENLNCLSRPNGKDSATAKGCGAYGVGAKQVSIGKKTVAGRWPANVVLDEEAGQLLDAEAGNVSRFFYCPKASKKDRGEGNTHPTVKPQALMTYLCRLITPTGGTVLDPFMGSGSTGLAAIAEDFDFTGIEKDPGYFATAEKRLTCYAAMGKLF